MSEVVNLNGVEDTELRIRLHEIEAKIREIKNKLALEVKECSSIRNDIYNLLLKLNETGVIEDVDSICDLVDSTEKKLGLEYEGESEISRLYTKVVKESREESNKEDSDEKQDESGYDSDCDEKGISTVQDRNIGELVDSAQKEMLLGQDLLDRVKMAKSNHSKLKTSLEKMQRGRVDSSRIKEDDDGEYDFI